MYHSNFKIISNLHAILLEIKNCLINLIFNMSSITIPDSLPQILKNYVKAAIRSQPEDIISWSAEYFKNADDQSDTACKHEKSSIYKQDRTMFRILAFQVSN